MDSCKHYRSHLCRPMSKLRRIKNGLEQINASDMISQCLVGGWLTWMTPIYTADTIKRSQETWMNRALKTQMKHLLTSRVRLSLLSHQSRTQTHKLWSWQRSKSSQETKSHAQNLDVQKVVKLRKETLFLYPANRWSYQLIISQACTQSLAPLTQTRPLVKAFTYRLHRVEFRQQPLKEE